MKVHGFFLGLSCHCTKKMAPWDYHGESEKPFLKTFFWAVVQQSPAGFDRVAMPPSTWGEAGSRSFFELKSTNINH